jgi:hypothetical protein
VILIKPLSQFGELNSLVWAHHAAQLEAAITAITRKARSAAEHTGLGRHKVTTPTASKDVRSIYSQPRPVKNMALCHVCIRSTQEWLIPRLINLKQPNPSEPLHWWHQPSWGSLLEAASEGCPLCRLIVAESTRPQEPDPFGTLGICSREVQDENATRLRWQVYAGGRIEIFSKEKQLKLQIRIAFDDGLSHSSHLCPTPA